jgi:plasmid stabilization system protein ParE
MEMTVLWTDSAIEDLQGIHDYLFSAASLKVASKITNAIVDRTLLLEKNPRIGQIEELLKHRNEEIRYLVDGHYKIVYLIDGNFVIVATVFDCRQNPIKLENIKI